MTPSLQTLLALGPLLLFLMAFAETSMPVGLLVPAGVSLALAAVLAHQGLFDWPPILLAAGGGALAGDSVGFWLGRRGGGHFRSVPGAAGNLLRGSKKWANRLFRGPPLFSVTTARLASFVRTFMPAAAGMSTLTYPRFLAYDILGVILWLALYVGIGVVAGESWRVASGMLGTGWAVVFLLALAGSWLVAQRGRRHDPAIRRDADEDPAAGTAGKARGDGDEPTAGVGR